MRRSIMTAALIALASPAIAQNAQPAPTVAEGVAAWRGGNENRAVEIWTPLAEAGNPQAQFHLGQAYRLGRGVAQPDTARARTLFEQAARQGHLGARTNLGLILYSDGNRVGGLRWLRGAADRGEPRAMLVYGTALFNGDQLERDYVTGYALVSRAAAQGLAPASTTLAQMDEVLPLEQRTAGVRLAQRLATGDAKLSDLLGDEDVQMASVDPVPPAQSPATTPARRPTVQTAEPNATRPPARPAAPTSPAPAPAANPASGWTVQLGAFSREGGAQSLYRQLSGLPVFAGKQPIYQKSGNVTRLRVGPFASAVEAKRACDVMASRGQACFAVAP
ncbi:SPOR domain-containing protein [Sphingomicrobium sediminis]|uniref:SPOR domain-containing protein n=1 Tax=Sphingomicrobium sediminis TaxID=2950949 RepID=A0A9X2J1G0_9SPHN|nr:SPOR domain-containing protein [Sphingomicrobium sediminis]MCM8556689.1 SPOR domain-containing protein [Sphingomicrobium sediminis]